jgi:hypothetical protein
MAGNSPIGSFLPYFDTMSVDSIDFESNLNFDFLSALIFNFS